MFLIHPNQRINIHAHAVLFTALLTSVALIDPHGFVTLAQVPQLQGAVVTRRQEVIVV